MDKRLTRVRGEKNIGGRWEELREKNEGEPEETAEERRGKMKREDEERKQGRKRNRHRKQQQPDKQPQKQWMQQRKRKQHAKNRQTASPQKTQRRNENENMTVSWGFPDFPSFFLGARKGGEGKKKGKKEIAPIDAKKRSGTPGT